MGIEINARQEKKRRFGTFSVGVIAAAMILLFALSGCNVMVDSSHNPTGIDFDTIDKKWTQEEVNSKVEVAMLLLSNQAKNLMNNYADLIEELRSEANSGDYDILAQIRFAREAQDIEGDISSDYKGKYVDTAKFYVSFDISYLIDEICACFDDADDSALFQAQVEAFQLANYMDQREFYASPADKSAKEDKFAELCDRIEDLGGKSVPQNSLFMALNSLNLELRVSIPERCGEYGYGYDIIQQFEDIAQFDAWTADLAALGYKLELR